jgi:hypothetical protein
MTENRVWSFLALLLCLGFAEGAYKGSLGVNVAGLTMAGFQLTLHGRIWVTPEDFPLQSPYGALWLHPCAVLDHGPEAGFLLWSIRPNRRSHSLQAISLFCRLQVF